MTLLRIATWNLDHASNSHRPKNLQVSQILKYSPDIVVLTETCEQIDLTHIGYQVVYPKTKNIYGKYWSSIWFNNRVRLIKEIETKNGEVAVCALLETPLGKIIVYGTIIAYRDFNVKNGSKPWDEHYKSIEWHGKDWLSIIESNQMTPFIVAGDFNQTRDGSNRYSTIDGIELLNAELEKCNLKCLTEENFALSGKLQVDPKKGYARANIDHICISHDTFTIIKVDVWNNLDEAGVYMSDHNAVFIDLL